MSTTATLLATAQNLLWGGTAVGCAALASRLCVTGLKRVFPFFFIYLVFRLVRSTGLYFLPYGTNLYGYIWVATAPLFWLANILVVLELYSLVLRDYPGIASLGRWVLMFGFAASIGVSGLTLTIDLSNPNELYRLILYTTAIERGVMTSLAIFLFVITLFLMWYPVPLSRNVLRHSAVCALYFLGSTMGLLVRNVAGHAANAAVNVAMNALDLTCLILWSVLLTRAGETSTRLLRNNWRPEQQARLLEQLSSVNAVLLRAARKPQEGR